MNKLTQLRRAAMDLLARREHGRAELRQKLWRRFSEVEPSDVDGVLDQLVDDGLLSEHRALSSFVRERIRRGHGPVKIRFDARHRGFDADAVELTMAAQEIDWIEAASDVLSRRFGGREAASSVNNIVDGLEGNEKEETLVSGNERRQIEIDQQKASRKEQARRYRFLTQRGFTGEQISEAMRSH